MSVQTIKIGAEETSVVIIDNFVEDPDYLVQLATDLAPFPSQTGHYYPGRRHRILPQDGEAFDYVRVVCQSLIPLMLSVYGVTGYDILDAGFSLVTTAPDDLQPLQSIPHFDYPDAESFAILHYLSKRPAGGTAFYRHQRTGFETLSQDRLQAYAVAREQDGLELAPARGYHDGDGNGFIELAKVEARYNRALIYPGRLLHSGLLPDDFNFSPDPRHGRLTGNIFIRAKVTP
ncbi:DUF6445 family protein [Asticcacaulis sp. AC402]|uniref:DUF6445 family protein n=1 Tax=Asticcacaulis sp. AC402 TaxID=1282361 RepID=UPI0003C3D53C|nr:DUF6445 family protein [Asticcacaulis sp. AC402]ESQ77455.1 hypothetical protein ABAC402_01245 [Asticcacaulis sp. AC402]